MAALADGDYARLVEPHRAALHAHCYRMLGSVHDAEDALQETLLRAWRGLARFEGRSSLRSWLYTIATNVCLTAVERRRVLPADVGPAGNPDEEMADYMNDPIWIEPIPDGPTRYDERESVELAFIAALQHLPPRQRAVLILREVLGFTGNEVATALDTSTASVHSALQRAHRTVDERLPAQSQQAALRALGDAGLRSLVDGYVEAWERGDVDALAAMLTEDATIAMPPIPTWYSGRDATVAFLRRHPFADGRRWNVVPTRANGQLAFAHYLDGEAHSIELVTVRGDRIASLVAFLDSALFPRFGLPDRFSG
jgi:RNA polymerase sigma-70 factor (ECF subfamily)